MTRPGFDTRFPTVEDLRARARRKIPRFAFEYLDGGCNEDVNLGRNTEALQRIELIPQYLQPYAGCDMRTELFGHTYDAPFGIAPIGLQGLVWPDAAETLAQAACRHNIPFVLSTVTTLSIERASELTEGRAWFQLYHPRDPQIRDDIIRRAAAAGCSVLVLLCDVPSFGFRPRDIRNGLSMPPKMTLRNVLQILQRPDWATRTLRHGRPTFETLRPYMRGNLGMTQLGRFMDETFSGRLNAERIAPIRDLWKGHLVLKGVASEADAAQAIELGLDGIIVSNHGGRQLDAGQATIDPLGSLAANYGERIRVMMDGGLRSGTDVARAMASGARFTFSGRAFMYGVAALGNRGGDHVAELFKVQLRQVMEQIGCETVAEFPRFLAR